MRVGDLVRGDPVAKALNGRPTSLVTSQGRHHGEAHLRPDVARGRPPAFLGQAKA